MHIFFCGPCRFTGVYCGRWPLQVEWLHPRCRDRPPRHVYRVLLDHRGATANGDLLTAVVPGPLVPRDTKGGGRRILEIMEVGDPEEALQAVFCQALDLHSDLPRHRRPCVRARGGAGLRAGQGSSRRTSFLPGLIWPLPLFHLVLCRWLHQPSQDLCRPLGYLRTGMHVVICGGLLHGQLGLAPCRRARARAGEVPRGGDSAQDEGLHGRRHLRTSVARLSIPGRASGGSELFYPWRLSIPGGAHLPPLGLGGKGRCHALGAG
mmetsp:Transcript_48166/g.109633  ORF Transcript_48166/g.109633 Transcript_48166/m.109633 type:complete len:264 (+) Transcript_48166:637-1428(+)